MLRTLVASLTLLLLGTATAVAAVAAPGQALRVDLTAGTPRVDKLAQYVTSTPLGVLVTAPSASSIVLQGVAPDGATLSVPLSRSANGAFTASVPVTTEGTWSFAVDAAAGSIHSVTESFTVDVVQDVSDDSTPLMMAALSAGSILCGLGLIVAARRVTARAAS